MSKNEKNLNKNNFFENIYIVASYLFLGVFSFSINYWTGSRGVFPVDTFVHFDPGVRILQGELPLRDFWIFTGLLVDYMGALFLSIFGNSWNSHLIHSSFMNILAVLFLYFFLNNLILEKKYIIFYCASFATLCYPVSGTPFAYIHSYIFSLISIMTFIFPRFLFVS